MRAAAILIAVAACAHPRPAPHHVQVPHVTAADDEITVSWVGHATCLVGIRGHWFLTDPNFADRIAGVVRRAVAPAISPRELPPLDGILISHSHFDHLDLDSLRSLHDAPLFVPPGVTAVLPGDLPQHDVVALDTWQSWTRGDVTITAVPASHGDTRYWFDLWHSHAHTGWMIQVADRTVYFAGDTGYVASQSRELARRFRIDVGIIPVGPAGRAHWIERWRAAAHATPDAAMDLFRDTHAQWMVPIHYGTFFQPADYERPLVEAAVARHHAERWVKILDIGETASFLY
ncbi:MAG TPA: MBL fold metallo-hydrolase [Kofleriaceae bacterium]|nr:MBL fold metallo-hydrolase [Kofleriaceae bacterium]